jgi:negative regulator of flagellin synthesis FlgM
MEEDKVILSQEAKKIQEAKKLMDSIPDIREEKVAKIKAQIENGTYQVEEKKLASKMIKESLLNELL